jgi:hypothetical protein
MKFKQASTSSCTHTNQFKPGIFPMLSNMRFGITQSHLCAAQLCFHACVVHPRLRTQHDAPDALCHCGFVSCLLHENPMWAGDDVHISVFNGAVHMQSERVGFQSGRGWHSNVRDLGPNLQEGVRCCVDSSRVASRRTADLTFTPHQDLFVGPAFPVLWRRS